MSEEADKVKSKRPSRSEILSRGIDKCISLCTDQLDMSKRKNDFESLQLTEREKETLTKGFMEKKAAAIEKLTKVLPNFYQQTEVFEKLSTLEQLCQNAANDKGDRKWRRTGDPEMDLRPLQYKLLFDYVTNLENIHEDLKKKKKEKEEKLKSLREKLSSLRSIASADLAKKEQNS
ncbi:hypothetical protein T4A_2356 [Trichinella pseudospiralis]|uniref:Uncharacterized protein n=1 Tax=Trichinella pseudospiralis TaxID=6337 RepID=A0A0V1EQP0_TRIPS|nr:hypothetical protein T4E_5898 [Trichinella pseudospiralis]KRY75932.1 hypothetical protein T4A_218 [Trichinella pseudospiralis]KRY76012.1 hypothetical protein T4A_2356 [Trichinella pseudospiralis]KRY89986.1 hypothetical protein T4D_5477 [Trichinella pseudospiralis]